MTEKITVSWFNDEKTVLLCTYNQDGWGWEDFFKALEQQKAMIESTDAPKVDVLVDVRKSTWMPKGGSLLSGMRKFSTQRHPRQGQTIIVGARGMVAAIASTVSKLMGPTKPDFQFAKDMDEAVEKLEEIKANRQEAAGKTI